jgi:hypothetical protein
MVTKQKNNTTERLPPIHFPLVNVLMPNDFDNTQKMVPNRKGPADIIDLSDTNAKVTIGNKIYVLNISKLKHFYTKNC